MTITYPTLTFDCYGTLIDWRRGISEAFDRVAGAGGDAIDRDRILTLHARIEPEVQTEGYRPYAQILDITATRIAAEIGLDIPASSASFLSESLPDWPAFADTGPALERLVAAGYRLGILSNVDDDLLAGTLRHLPVDFDLLVTAEQVGSYKPAPGHFDAAHTEIGDSGWLHVAQSFFHDVEPALARRLPVVWINRLYEEPLSGAPPLAVFPDLETFALAATTDRRFVRS